MQKFSYIATVIAYAVPDSGVLVDSVLDRGGAIEVGLLLSLASILAFVALCIICTYIRGFTWNEGGRQYDRR